jgi:translation elongation factor EF-G
MSQEIHIRASVPETIEGDVMSALNRLGGVITTIEREGDSRTTIGSTIPKKHIGKFKDWLQTFSNGRGSFAEDNT